MDIKANAISLLLLTTLTACAGLNEGVVDYRVISRNTVVPHTDSEQLSPLDSYHQKFFAQKAPIKLIQKDKSISVKLMAAYICDFREAALSLNIVKSKGNKGDTICGNGSNVFNGTNTAGEIAIIVNAFERDGNNAIEFDESAIDKGRLVFYSNDVRASGQPLNLTNLPVYGPINYNGNPFYMSITVLELDNEENQQMKDILGKVSSLGSKAFPPASDELRILNTIGSTLLSGEQNDVEFKHQLELDPIGGSGTVYRAPLSTGYYVFIRSERRNQYEKLTANLVLDEKTGKLHTCASKPAQPKSCNKKGEPWIGGTYLTFKIDTDESSLALDTKQLFSQFKDKQTEILSARSDAVNEIFTRERIALKKKNNVNIMKDSLNLISSTKEIKSQRSNSLKFIQTVCADFLDTETSIANENEPSVKALLEEFNLSADMVFVPTATACTNKSNYVKALTFQ